MKKYLGGHGDGLWWWEGARDARGWRGQVEVRAGSEGVEVEVRRNVPAKDDYI